MHPFTQTTLLVLLLSLGVALGLLLLGQFWAVLLWVGWWGGWFWRWRNQKPADALEAGLGPEESPHLLSAMTQVSQLLLNPYQERRVDRALQVLAQNLGADRGFVIGYIDSPRWQVYHHWSAAGQVPWDRLLPLRGENLQTGLFGPNQLKQLQRGQPVYLSFAQLLPIDQEIFRALGIASAIAVPVFVEGQWWGVLGLASIQSERGWQTSEAMLLQTAANSLAGAIELSQSEIARLRGEVDYQQLYMRVEQNRLELLRVNQLLQGVSQATRGLVGSNDQNSLQTFLERLGVFAKADRVYIYQFQAQQALCYGEWNAEGIPQAHRDAHQTLWAAEWLQSLQQGQPLVLHLASLSPAHQFYLAKSQTKTLIGVPLRVEGQPWGFIGLDNCQEERLWMEGDVRTLQTAANALSEFLGRLQARQNLELRNQLLQGMAQATQLLVSANNLSVLSQVLEQLGPAANVDRCYIYQYQPGPTPQSWLHSELYEWCAPGIEPSLQQMQNLPSNPERRKQYETEGFFIWNHQDMGHPSHQTDAARLAPTGVNMALFKEGVLWGFIGFENVYSPRTWQRSDIQTLQTVANAIGEFLLRLESKEALESYNRLLSAVSQGDADLVGADDPQRLALYLERLGQSLEASRVFLLQHQPDAQQQKVAYKVRYSWSLPHIPSLVDAVESTSLDYGWLQPWVQGENLARTHLDASEVVRASMSDRGVGSFLALPVFCDGGLWGVLAIDDSARTQPWHPAELHVLQTACNSLGEFLARLNAKAELAWRNDLLQAVALASQALVGAQHLSALGEVVQQVGPAARVDRCVVCIYDRSSTTQNWRYRLIEEWHKPDLDNLKPHVQNWASSPEVRNALLSQGYTMLNISQMPTQLMAIDGVNNGLAIGLFLDGVLWGFLGLQTQSVQRWWQDAEIQSLRTVANAIGEFLGRLESKTLVERRNRLLEGLAIGSQVLLSADGPEAIWDFVELAGTTLESDRCYLYQYHPHPETGKLAISGRYGWSKPEYSPAWEDVRNGSPHLPWYESLRSGQPLLVYQDQFPRYLQPWFATRSIQSFLSVPVLQDGALWGALTLEDCVGQKEWSDTEVRALEAAASSLSSFLSRQRSKADLERQNRFFLAVAETAQRLLVGETDAAIQEALKGMAQALGAGGAYIEQLVVDESSGEERLTMLFHWVSADSGMKAQVGWLDYTLRKPYEPFLEAMRRNEALLLSLADVPLERRDYLLHQGIGAFLDVPIFLRGNLWGIFGFDFGLAYAERLRLSPRDIEAARTAAAALAAVLQKRAFEVGLHRSEARFKAMMEALPSGIVRVNAEGIAFYANPAFLNASGLSPIRVLGHSIYEWVPPQAMPMIKAQFVQLIEQHQVMPALEIPYQHPDGQLRTVEISAVPLIEDGQSSALVLFRDVSDTARTTENLQRSNRFFFAVAEATQALLHYGNDPQSLLSALGLLGKAIGSDGVYIERVEPNPAGQPQVSILVRWHAPHKPPIGQLDGRPRTPYVPWLKALEQNQHLAFSAQQYPPDRAKQLLAQGVLAFLEVPIWNQGSLWGILGFDFAYERVLDAREVEAARVAASVFGQALQQQSWVSGLHQSETRFRQLTQSLPIGVLQADASGKVFYVNPGFVALLGRGLHEVLGASVLDLFAPELLANWPERYDRLLQQQALEPCELLVNRSGERGVLELSGVPVLQDNGTGALLLLRDVTERKRAEKAIERQQSFFLAVAEIAQRLLAQGTDRDVLQEAVATLGQALGADGAYIERFHPDPLTQEERVSLEIQWVATGRDYQLDLDAYKNRVPYFPWLNLLKQDQPLAFTANQYPEDRRGFMLQQGVLAFVEVPVWVSGSLWGIFGFDFSQEVVFSPREIQAARVAAACLGEALEQKAYQSHLLESEARYRYLFEEAQYNNRLLEVLAAFDRNALQLAHPNQVVTAAELQPVAQAMLVQRITYHTLHAHPLDGQTVYSLQQMFAMPGHEVHLATQTTQNLPVHPAWLELLKTDQPVVFYLDELAELGLNDPQEAWVINQQIKAYMAVPIKVQGVLWGFLGFEQCQSQRVWKTSEIEAARTLGLMVGRRIELAQSFAALTSRNQAERHLLQQISRQAQELEFLLSLRQALSSFIAPQRLFQTLLDQLRAVFGYDISSVYLIKEDHLVLEAYSGYTQVIERIPKGQGVMWRSANQGQSILVAEANRDPSFLFADAAICSSITVPLQVEGRTLAVLNVESRSQTFTPRDLEIIEAVAAQVGLVLERSIAVEQLRQQEALYRSAFDAYPDCVTLIDDRRVVYMNPAACQALGIETLEDIVGQSLEVFSVGGTAPRDYREYLQAALEGQTLHWHYDQVRTLSGKIIDIEVAVKPFTAGNRRLSVLSWRVLDDTKGSAPKERSPKNQMF